MNRFKFKAIEDSIEFWTVSASMIPSPMVPDALKVS
jgi:hypothetical protein